MKKILAISGVVLGTIILSGCGSQTTTKINPQKQVPRVIPPMQVPASVETSTTPAATPSMTPDSSTTNLPTTPAKTSDVDNSLNQIDKDLKSIDSNAPNSNDLNSTDLQK